MVEKVFATALEARKDYPLNIPKEAVVFEPVVKSGI